MISEQPSEAADGFDTVRITSDIDALAEMHAGHEDVFRSALAQLLKGELVKAREAAQAHGLRFDGETAPV